MLADLASIILFYNSATFPLTYIVFSSILVNAAKLFTDRNKLLVISEMIVFFERLSLNYQLQKSWN